MKTKVRSNLTAIVWKDTQNVSILMNMHSPPLEGNFCNEQGKAVKLAIVDYNRHTGYVDKSDHITNTYSISRPTWDWRKKLFFRPLDLTILNSFINLTSCCSKLSN